MHTLHRQARKLISMGQTKKVRVFDADDQKELDDGTKVPHEGEHIAVRMAADGEVTLVPRFDSRPRKPVVVKPPREVSWLSRAWSLFRFREGRRKAAERVKSIHRACY